MNPFAIFNHPYTITHISATEGYNKDFDPLHPSSGVWVPITETRTTIYGHISSITEKDRIFLPDNVTETGVRKLSVENDVVIETGDKIEVTEPDGTITLWYVDRQVKTSSVLELVGIKRRQYYITMATT